MKKSFLFTLVFLSSFLYAQDKVIKHFIFFSREREGIHDSPFYTNPGITGAQITYPWKDQCSYLSLIREGGLGVILKLSDCQIKY